METDERKETRLCALIAALSDDRVPLVVASDDGNAVECASSGTGCDFPAFQEYGGRIVSEYPLEAAAQVGAVALGMLIRPSEEGRARECIGRWEGLFEPILLTLGKDEEEEALRRAANFELFGVSKPVLDSARDLARLSDSNAVVLLSAEQPRVTAEHLSVMLDDFCSRDVDVVLSWARITRTMPMILRRSFLEGLEASCLCRPVNNDAHRGVGSIKAFEHDFGRINLAPSSSFRCDPMEKVFDRLSISALQAVRIAKAKGAGKAAAVGGLSDANWWLVGIAREALSAMEPSDDDEIRALCGADGFGKRARLDFPLLSGEECKDSLAYMDTAATGQRVATALDAQRDYDIHANCNTRRSIYGLIKKSTAAWSDSRSTILRFIGAVDERGDELAKGSQLSITANATAALNLVACGWGDANVKRGDLVLCWESEHHSNLLPWMMLARRTGAVFRLLPLDAAGRIDMGAYREALADRPRLVSCAQIGNVIGIENPVEEMSFLAHEAGARFVVDAAQSLAHCKVDVSRMGADFVAVSGHKMYGPQGIGALWSSKEAFEEMSPVFVGGGMVTHVTPDGFEPHRAGSLFEAGSQPVSQLVGWAAAAEYLERLGEEAISSAEAALTRHLMRGLCSIRSVTVFGDHGSCDGQNGLVSFSVRGLSPTQVVKALDSMGVAVRGGSHCALPLGTALGVTGTTRISLGVYSTAEDVEATVTAVLACVHAFGR